VFEAAPDRARESPAELRVHSFKLLARPVAVSLIAGLERARLRFFKAIRPPADLTIVVTRRIGVGGEETAVAGHIVVGVPAPSA
jgi:hypothetical protein